MELPIGSIIIWRGGTIPDKWAICDGNNGTPNLINRFVYGASTNTDLNNTGGSATHTHSNPNTGSRSAHSHTGGSTNSTYSGHRRERWGALSDASQNHRHSVTFNTTNTADGHSHTVGNTGDGSSLPPYLNRIFIMKIA